jgi:hypothetical protein
MSPQSEVDGQVIIYGATLLMTTVQSAIKEVQGDTPELRELFEALGNGKASLALYVQRHGDTVYVSAAALPPGRQDPFKGAGPRLVWVEGTAPKADDMRAQLQSVAEQPEVVH